MKQAVNQTRCVSPVTPGIRERLKAEILTMTDKQAEYVLWRLQNEKKSS